MSSRKHPRAKTFPLVPVQLTQVRTSDGIDLAGVVVEPKGKKKAALIWLHGLTSSFDSGQELMRQLSVACTKMGVGYFKFNTRGHHIADWGPRHMEGAAFERFSDSLKDINAIISFVRKRGYRKFILAGHSTGSNKVVYFVHKKRPRGLIGVLLLGPVCDIVAQQKAYGRRRLQKMVTKAQRMARKSPDSIISMKWGGILSAQRFVSLYLSGTVEDTFPWYDNKQRWTALRSVVQPIHVVFGSRDQFLDQPALRITEFFRQQAIHSNQFTADVITGASHGFHRHQRQLTTAITAWLRTLI